MTADKFYTSLSANNIMANFTNHIQRTRRITPSTDKHYSLDCTLRMTSAQLSKPRQSPTIVLFRTTLTRTITQYEQLNWFLLKRSILEVFSTLPCLHWDVLSDECSCKFNCKERQKCFLACTETFLGTWNCYFWRVTFPLFHKRNSKFNHGLIY